MIFFNHFLLMMIIYGAVKAHHYHMPDLFIQSYLFHLCWDLILFRRWGCDWKACFVLPMLRLLFVCFRITKCIRIFRTILAAAS